MQEKRTSGLIPVDSASVGTSGYNAGHTTPRVLEKKLMIAPTKLNAIGISLSAFIHQAAENDVASAGHKVCAGKRAAVHYADWLGGCTLRLE